MDALARSGDCRGCLWDVPEEYRIWRGDRFAVNFALDPSAFGHTVVMVRRAGPEHQLKDITDLEDPDFAGLMGLAGRIARALREEIPKVNGTAIERVYMATFNESCDWHIHVHVVPRSAQTREIGPRLLEAKFGMTEGARHDMAALKPALVRCCEASLA